MSFDAHQKEQITQLLLSEDDQNKLLGCQLLVNADTKDLFALKRVLCVATYLGENFRNEIEGELEILMQKNLPAALLYQLQNEIIILDYARYKFNVKEGWHSCNNPLRKYLNFHQKYIKKYIPIFKINPSRFVRYYLVLASRIEREMENRVTALFYYNIVLELDPSSKGAKLGVAKNTHQLYLKKGLKLELYPTILNYYLEGFSSKDNMFPYIQAALLCADREDIKQSQEIYQKGLEIDGEESTLLNNYANLLYKELGDFDTAKKMVKKAIAIKREASSFDTLAHIEMLGFGNLDKAEKAFMKALTIDNTNHWAYTGLGDLYILKKEYQKAEDNYKKGLYSDLQFASRNKKDVIEKLEKILLLYNRHIPNKEKNTYYQKKLNTLKAKKN